MSHINSSFQLLPLELLCQLYKVNKLSFLSLFAILSSLEPSYLYEIGNLHVKWWVKKITSRLLQTHDVSNLLPLEFEFAVFIFFHS